MMVNYLDYNALLRCNKISLQSCHFIHKKVKQMPQKSTHNTHHRKKSKNLKIYVKTQKECEESSRPLKPEVSAIKTKRHDKNQKGKNFRHTSMITKNTERSKEQHESNLSTRRNIQKQTVMDRKLPEIYQPQLNSTKMVNMSIEKYKLKNKSSTTSEILESRKTDNMFNESRKVELGRKSLKLKLTELQPVKDLNKEQKNKIFKIIRNQFQDLINSTNYFSIKNQDNHFKAYVEKGNNGLLVKELLKKRWWWHIQERDPHKANLVWTEWFNKSITEEMEDLGNNLETMENEDYTSRAFEVNKNEKESSIKKIVDEFTFSKIQQKLDLKSQNYFKNNKNGMTESLWEITNKDQVKKVKVDVHQAIHNHVDGCLQLHSKKLLFKNLYNLMKKKKWNPFQFIPLTFYIDQVKSPVVDQLFQAYDQIERNVIIKQGQKDCENIWICKPGQNSNRGHGIKVLKDRVKIKREIEERLAENTEYFERRTVIFQKYLQNCFLIKNRKFDIRCFILLTTVNGILKGYWFRDGYIRTSSEEYNLKDIDNVMVHLTNDAVQKKGQSFGKYEDYNKMTFEGFKKYLHKVGIEEKKFDETYEQMKLIAYYMIMSVSSKIKRKQFTFQLFGLDFMLDSNLSPYLIEANSNPCLENHGKIMGSLIHRLIDNVLMTAIDPIFPPPFNTKKNCEYIGMDYFEWNRFELIFSDKSRREK